MTKAFYLLIAAQFISGLADNALLVVTIARLTEVQAAAWLAPGLKLFFTLAYVVLAPFVGVLADKWPKARVMLQSNLLKALACILIGVGVNPLAAFAIAGLGAACYSPAKYGLVTELVAPQQLVKANGWIEVTMVGSIILGTLTGGLLVSPWFTELSIAPALAPIALIDTSLYPSLFTVLGLYLLAAVLNQFIPDSGARYPHVPLRPVALMVRFWDAQRTLWRDRLGGLSLGVTTLFWGAGATLQFVVLAWAQNALGLTLDKAAYLQGVVAIGITAGAAAAGAYVALHDAPKVLTLGIIMGVTVPLMAFVDSVAMAWPLLILVGALAGFFVVPMNALLQHRGLTLLSAGESIAVQNFNENLSVLVMLACYSSLLAIEFSINALIFTLGAVVAISMAWIRHLHRKNSAGFDIDIQPTTRHMGGDS